MARLSFRSVAVVFLGSLFLYYTYVIYDLRKSQTDLRYELDESRRMHGKEIDLTILRVKPGKMDNGGGTNRPMTNRPTMNPPTTNRPATNQSPTNRLSKEQAGKHKLSNPRSSMNAAPQPKASWDRPAAGGSIRNVTILMWTTYYGNKDLTDHIQADSPVPDWCHVTFDRDYLNDSDALVFSMVGDDFLLPDLPPRHFPQPWIYFIIEPPSYHKRDGAEVNGLFNRTMSYRLDSDYPCPYGYLEKRDKPLAENPYYADPSFPRTKTNLIAWMVSHCESLSNREKVVEIMKRVGLSVDVYGGCGTFSCPKGPKEDETGCYGTLGKKYKFYLSFENSVCRDYITEKFSDALSSDLVPIVYGGGDYDAVLPPYPKPGYINVLDYGSPKEFAQYLLYLDQNETAYAEYFEWKQYYRTKIRQGFSGFEKICYDFQKSGEVEEKIYGNLEAWWVKDGNCQLNWPVHWK